MDTSVKSRQTDTIPKSIGRQIGVIPVGGGGGKLRRGNGDVNIPVGSTDLPSDSPQSYQPKPPSGPSNHGSKVGTGSRRSSKIAGQNIEETEHSDRFTEGKTKSTYAKSRTALSSQRKLSNSSSSLHGETMIGSAETKPLQPLGSNRSSGLKSSIGLSRSTSRETTRKPPSSIVKRSSKGVCRQDSSRSTSDHVDDDLPLDMVDTEDQDIRFINIPSQRSRPGSKVMKSPGSADGRQTADGGKKPYKTIDPEEILAQNMESDLHKIYEIGLHASEITHIDHLEKFKKLRVLDLSCNFIEQIQNLELTKDLRELKLYDNRLRRIEGLENLKELNTLQLQHNRIRTIGKGLSGLKKLKTLRLDCNQLLKIETPELSQCVQLTSLDISYNMLDSLTALNYLPNLEEMNASGNRLKSVSDLSKCKQLQEIDLSGNRLTDLSGLRGLPKLMTLNISNNQLTSLKSMGRLKSLQDLLAGTNHIYDLTTIPTQLPVLETLDLTNNDISDWDEFYNLETMTELVELFIACNPFCAQDGSMPHYFSAIQAVLPDLEIIDGAHIKKHVSKGAPLMRPMSASTIVSLRQMDTQMRSADDQMKTLEKSLEEKFASLRATCDSLPLEPPKSSRLNMDTPETPSSRCNSRNRILQARQFAASNKK